MQRVVVIGSANIDLTIKSHRIPKLGETVSGGHFYTSFGGKGANQAVAALNAGADVSFISRVGCDTHGDAMMDHLKKIGLSLEGIVKDQDYHTGVALIMVDNKGRNIISVAPGCNWKLTSGDVRSAEPLIASADVLLVQLEVDLTVVSEALTIAKNHHLTTILNPAPALSIPLDIYPMVDILTPNEVEALGLAGIKKSEPFESTILQAAHTFLKWGVGEVMVTMGQSGVIWVKESFKQHLPSFEVKAVDSTGAGDVFNGALAYATSAGMPKVDAIRFANAAAAICVTRAGAQDSIPSQNEIKSLIIK
ncbi:MAG: ribokinase [Thermodesulfobacteriota bacterium]|nr:ribokinase [Thermodesulfobacteriota bacterium]